MDLNLKLRVFSRIAPHNRLRSFGVAVWVLASSPLAAFASNGDDAAFTQVVHAYESVRLALLNDTLEGVQAEGKQIASVLAALSEDPSAERATVTPDAVEELRGLLPQLRTAAADLSIASNLDDARDALYELSKPLVRWRKHATVEVPAVAYCPMAKRSWLQPEGTIGNPYYGQSMATCGDLVPDR